MRKKLKSNRGETLIEVLVSMLIIVLGLAMLAGAIVTSARVNKTASERVTLVEGSAGSGEDKTASISGSNSDSSITYSGTYGVKLYEETNGG